MPAVIDAARARAILDDAYGAPLDEGEIQIREGNNFSGTLIVSIDLGDPAFAAATGTGSTPGSRSMAVAGTPLTGEAVGTTANDAVDLFAFYVNSSGVALFGPDLVTTDADGTGVLLVSNTDGHAANPKKPVITTGNDVRVDAGSFTL